VGKNTEVNPANKIGGENLFRDLSAESESIGQTLPAKIHELLEEAIIRGELEPSSRLQPEGLAAQYGVSRVPVREALRSLHEAGWVEIRPHYGVYVRERSMLELRELFEARAGIEAHIAELAATNRTDEDLAAMRQIVEAGRASVKAGNLGATSYASVAFNDAIRKACGNSLLANLAAALEKRARFYFAMVEGDLGSDWIDLEARILQAIFEQDVQQAGEVSRSHIQSTGHAVSKLLDT